MSERELRALEEWAPKTVHTRTSSFLQKQTQTRSQGQGQGQGTVNANPNVHGNGNSNANTSFNTVTIPTGPRRAVQTTNRRRGGGRSRGRNHTSSIFDEWRAQALTDDGHKGESGNADASAATATAVASSGPSGPIVTSASTAGCSENQPVAGQPTSAPIVSSVEGTKSQAPSASVASSAQGTKGRSYRGRGRKDSHARQGSASTEGGQKNTVSGKDSITAPAGPSAGTSEGQCVASVDTKATKGKVDATVSVSPSVGDSDSRSIGSTAALADRQHSTSVIDARTRSQTKDSHARKDELSKVAAKDSSAASAGPSADSSKTHTSSTAGSSIENAATGSGTRSRRGKNNSHCRGGSGRSVEDELKKVASSKESIAIPEGSSVPPANPSPVVSIADGPEKQPGPVDSSQSQAGRGRKSRHARQKSASISAGESGKDLNSKESKDPLAKRSSAPVASTAGPEGKSAVSSAGKGLRDKESTAKSQESSVKPLNGHTAPVVSASGGQPGLNSQQSKTDGKDSHSRQAAVSAFVDEWESNDNTATYEEFPVEFSSAHVTLTDSSPEGQHVAGSDPQPQTTEEEFHDCQVSISASDEGSKENVSSKEGTVASKEAPVTSSAPVLSTTGPSKGQPAVFRSQSQPETGEKESHTYQQPESTISESEKTESNNGGTHSGMPISSSSTPAGSAAGQPERKSAGTANSDEAKTHAQQDKSKNETHSRQGSSQSASTRESIALAGKDAIHLLIQLCLAQAPNSKPTQPIPKGPKADNANRRASKTVEKALDKRTVSNYHEDPRQEGFRAPNGAFFNKNQLARFAEGFKNLKGGTTYFMPSFIEDDPWAGMKPVKIGCTPRHW